MTARRDPARHGHRASPRLHRDSRRRCAAAAACGPVTGCCWPRSPARTRSPLTRSPWWTRPSGPTARSRTPQEDSRDHPAPGRAPGRIPAGRRRRGAADAGADGPVPGRPGDRPAGPAAGADLRRVRPGGVRGGHRRRPAGRTARTGTGSSSSGASGGWTSRPRRRSGS